MKQGEFELKLNENVYILRCSPAALRFVETKHGGLRNAMQKLLMVEFAFICDLVRAGLMGHPLEKSIDFGVLEEEIFKQGVLNLVEPLVNFLNLLGNGGRPVDEKAASTETGEK